MMTKEIIEELRSKLTEELTEKIKEQVRAEIDKEKCIKILTKEDIKKLFNCSRTKMNEIMHSIDKPPVVYIGREYYSSEKQMSLYFSSKKPYINPTNQNKYAEDSFKVLHKEDLVNMFKMNRTKFKKFIDHKQCPVKVKGDECYITSEKLQQWFYDFEGLYIEL